MNISEAPTPGVDAFSLSTVYAEIGVVLHNGRAISTDDHHLLFQTHMNRDLVTLKAFLHHLRHTTHRLGMIKSAYDIAHMRGLEPGQYLSHDSLNTYVRVWSSAVDIQEQHPGADGAGIVYFSMMADESDRDMIEQIIIDRLPESVVEIQGILEQMKGGSATLSPGAL